GASSDIVTGGPTEAEWAGPLLQSLGLRSGRIIIEAEARNTYENALNTWRLVHPAAGECWLLVTSAAHMPRAMGTFRRVGWNPTAWPVSYKTGHSVWTWFSQSPSQRLAGLDSAAHEWFGLLAYRLMDRTDALFPGPSSVSPPVLSDFR